MIRRPAFAGSFYPADPKELSDTLLTLVKPSTPPARALGVLVPHAGYMYSGHVAGAVYGRVAIPSRVILLCPNHTGYGAPLAIMRTGFWQTPLGQIRVDEELCDALMAANSYLQDDLHAHRYEHAVEVQLPFLQHLSDAPLSIAPITVGSGNFNRLEDLGAAMAEVIGKSDGNVLIVASSDMNHYEPDVPTRLKDQKAIGEMLAQNPRGLYDTVKREKITMSGYGSAVAMLHAANMLGTSGAELVRYRTSGDVSGDLDHVVGYAGIIVA